MSRTQHNGASAKKLFLRASEAALGTHIKLCSCFAANADVAGSPLWVNRRRTHREHNESASPLKADVRVDIR
jgi:hypothetical protein